MSDFDYLMGITGRWAIWAYLTLSQNQINDTAESLGEFALRMGELVVSLASAEDEGTEDDLFHAKARIGFHILDNLATIKKADETLTELGNLMLVRGEAVSVVDLFTRLAKASA